MDHRTFKLLAGASLLLCVFAIMALALSYADITLISSRGTLYVARATGNAERVTFEVERDVTANGFTVSLNQHIPTPLGNSCLQYRPIEKLPSWEWIGFRCWRGKNIVDISRYILPPAPTPVIATSQFLIFGISYNWLIVASAATPVAGVALWIGGWARRLRRQKQKLFVRCGYDMRVSTDRCPECGAVPAALLSN